MQQKLAAHQSRKQKLTEFDSLRSTRVPLKPLSIDSQANIETIFTRAQAMLNEEENDVKTMNKMILFMKTMRIRDKQLIENQRMEQEFLRNQRKLDTIMEIERLKALKVQAERRKVRLEEAARGG